MFVQDKCPVESSSLARCMLRDKRAKQLKLPPRGGDIHCIEKLFHAVKVELDKQVLELNSTCETYEEFSEHVITTIKNMPVDVVDKIIESMDNRISLVIFSKGQRTKYQPIFDQLVETLNVEIKPWLYRAISRHRSDN